MMYTVPAIFSPWTVRHTMNGNSAGRSGFTFLVVMFSIVLIGLSLAAAVQQWTTVMKREREAELLFRGDQIRVAIGKYYQTTGIGAYPRRLEDLIKQPNVSRTKRFLRKLYKDPVTGGDWVLVKVGDRIKGVHSPSEEVPLKQGNFPEAYQGFEGKTSYREWVFEFVPQQVQPPGNPKQSRPAP